MSLFGSGFRDLYHGRGLRCRFGEAIVNASVVNGLHMVCNSPGTAQTNTGAPTCSTFPRDVQISLNAQDWLPGRQTPFRFLSYCE